MDLETATAVLAALAQATRLETFRLLVRHEPDGLPAGEVARQLDIPQNTMSAHLAVLTRAGLAISERHSRSIIYRADLNRLRELTLYLVKDCCGENAELCAPLIAEPSAPCCSPTELGPLSSKLREIKQVEGFTTKKGDAA
jgi:ArsR family transcriptional regulator, arsenate/arsenite/antimonite-responsive transcriptional repressor